ncbi:MAG: DUF3298 and DUF4163 domain-containing protein [Oscillospiraceae bacterium]|nr:DUF3298 and DUF4163 domain-containing protein [Oscillospiraceae bacterium]
MNITEIKKEFDITFGDITLVGVKIRLPQVGGYTKEARRINSYYKALMAHWERYANKSFVKHAKKQYEFLTKRGFIFNTFTFTVDFTVTLNDSEVLSLYIDKGEYTGGANGTVVRSGDTWKSGYPFILKETESRGIQRQIIDAIRKRQEAGEPFFEPIKRYVRKFYDPKQYFFTPDGIALFFQEITIAPHSAGIVCFENVV